MSKRSYFALFFCVFIPLISLTAQDGFGFGFADGSDDAGAAPSPIPAAPSVKISGEVSAKLLGYIDDFSSFSTLKETTLGDIFAGKLNFFASALNAEGVVNLQLSPVFDGSASPVELGEAYLRAYFGNFSVEGGLRKLTWGKADSFGPLDVVNPIDYRDLTEMTNLMDRKIARPMVHASYTLGSFSKLEGVFIPWFQGHRFADAGRWAPSQVTAYPGLIGSEINAEIQRLQSVPQEHWPSDVHEDLKNAGGIQKIQDHYANMAIASLYPGTLGLEYLQGGMRFTTTAGSSDIGIQYFSGCLFRPAIMVIGQDGFLQNPYGITPQAVFNRYHQIGADYAQVIAGFNLRAELAANITGDLAGDDGAVYNPSIGWSAGFDRDVVWGINLNLQATESVRLLHDKVGDSIILDTEAGTGITATRITLIISKKFLRDELEIKATGIWGIEDKDFYILPALIWTKWDLKLEVSGGFLGGDGQGELGQYHKNSFIRTSLTYSF
ncbi:MAG: hypothetical protein LBD55_10320 [Treponema sp.]|jgi:hypothetical protein|nr:hypothetical protein [Treponema sp.]